MFGGLFRVVRDNPVKSALAAGLFLLSVAEAAKAATEGRFQDGMNQFNCFQYLLAQTYCKMSQVGGAVGKAVVNQMGEQALPALAEYCNVAATFAKSVSKEVLTACAAQGEGTGVAALQRLLPTLARFGV